MISFKNYNFFCWSVQYLGDYLCSFVIYENPKIGNKPLYR